MCGCASWWWRLDEDNRGASIRQPLDLAPQLRRQTPQPYRQRAVRRSFRLFTCIRSCRNFKPFDHIGSISSIVRSLHALNRCLRSLLDLGDLLLDGLQRSQSLLDHRQTLL